MCFKATYLESFLCVLQSFANNWPRETASIHKRLLSSKMGRCTCLEHQWNRTPNESCDEHICNPISPIDRAWSLWQKSGIYFGFLIWEQIQKYFCLKTNIPKENDSILRIGVVGRCKKCQNLTFKVNFLWKKSSKSFSIFFHWTAHFSFLTFFDNINF